MASLDSMVVRSLGATKCSRRTAEAAGVVLRIKHVGTGTGTPTVVLSDTSSDITLTDGAGTVITADLSNGSYNTVGKVADWINGDPSWECKVMDALRSQASNDVWTNGAVSAATKNGETVFDVTQLIASGTLNVRCTYDELIGSTRAKGEHRVTLNAFSYFADLTAAANSVQIWLVDSKGATEEQIWGALSVDTTLVAYAPSSATYPFSGITAPSGKDIVIVVTGTVVTNAGNFLQAEFTRE